LFDCQAGRNRLDVRSRFIRARSIVRGVSVNKACELFSRNLAEYSADCFGRSVSYQLHGPSPIILFGKYEKVAYFYVQSLGQFDQGVHGRATLASQNFGDMTLREIGFQIEPV
jgi:hypothetical protein